MMGEINADLWTCDIDDPCARFDSRAAAIADGLIQLSGRGQFPSLVDTLTLWGLRVTVGPDGREFREVMIEEQVSIVEWLRERATAR